MKLKSLLFALSLGILPFSIMAGSGHDHDHGHSHSQAAVNQATAKTKATEAVSALVKRKKLDTSWTSVTASSIEKIKFKGNTEWRAIFINKKIADEEKQKLYIFLTPGGEYIAANFTGN